MRLVVQAVQMRGSGLPFPRIICEMGIVQSGTPDHAQEVLSGLVKESNSCYVSSQLMQQAPQDRIEAGICPLTVFARCVIGSSQGGYLTRAVDFPYAQTIGNQGLLLWGERHAGSRRFVLERPSGGLTSDER